MDYEDGWDLDYPFDKDRPEKMWLACSLAAREGSYGYEVVISKEDGSSISFSLGDWDNFFLAACNFNSFRDEATVEYKGEGS